MFSVRAAGLLTAVSLGILAMAGVAQAQTTNVAGAQNYAGIGKATGGAGCPGIAWSFRAGAAEPVGYVLFTDDSGISSATGTLNKATGAFHLTLASIDGKGPTGTIDGTKGADGSLNAVLTGPGCSNVTIKQSKPNFIDGNQK